VSIRVYLERNVTPQLIEDALPLVQAMHREIKGGPLPGLNSDFIRDAIASDVLKVVLARDGDQLIGFLTMYVFRSILGAMEASITHVYVDKTHRGRKLAVADQMVQLARAMADAAKARCSVVAEKEHAINLFLRTGFVATGAVLESAHV